MTIECFWSVTMIISGQLYVWSSTSLNVQFFRYTGIVNTFIITNPLQCHEYRYQDNNDTLSKSVFLKIEILKPDLSTIFEDKECYRYTDCVQGFTSIWRRTAILNWNFYHFSHQQFLTNKFLIIPVPL